jgi:hypothetical protein
MRPFGKTLRYSLENARIDKEDNDFTAFQLNGIILIIVILVQSLDMNDTSRFTIQICQVTQVQLILCFTVKKKQGSWEKEVKVEIEWK